MFFKEKRPKDSSTGRAPEDWELSKLGEILTLSNGERPTILEKGAIPVYGANGIMGYTSEPLAENDFSIIFGRVGASGEVHLAKGKIWVSDNAIYSKSYDRQRVNLPFFSYYLKFKKLAQFASKTTHPIITQTFLNNFPVKCPPLKEQHMVVEVLSCVDLAIQKTDEVVAKTERLKKGLMQKLLTEGIGHKEFKDTEIGKIPRTWEVATYGKVTGRITYGFTNPMPHVDTGHYIITAKSIIDGKIDYSSAVVTSEEAYSESLTEKSRPKIGDVLLSKDGTIGRSAVVDRDGICVNQSVAVLIPKKDLILPSFLSLSLESPNTQNLIQLHSAQTTIAHIAITKLAKMKFGLPSISEQKRMTDIISCVDRKLQVEKMQESTLSRVKQSLMDLLLTGKVRVRMD
jgi:type I restriction enzyme S subunit